MKKKPRRLKIFIVVVSILMICVMAALVFFLIGEYSQGKMEYEAQMKKETKEFTGKLVEELDLIDTSDEGLQSITKENTAAADVPDEVITDAERQAVAETLQNLEDQRKQQVLQKLSAVYSQALDEQKLDAYAKVDDLVSQAKAEWAAVGKGEDDESALKRGSLITEYMAKSKVLEDQMDESFNILVTKMEEQLAAEGIAHTAIIETYKEEYQRIKEENRKIMMEKAWAAIKD